MDTEKRERISVAMATYNGVPHIEKQLDSIAEQQLLPDELVIYDDASDDKTLEIVENFSNSAPFEVFVYQNNINSGYIKTFEQTISKSTGDIIFLSDQDDYWLPKKIKEVVSLFREKSEVSLIVNDQEFTDENFNKSGISNLERIRHLGLTENQLRSGCCTAFRKELKPLILPFPEFIKGHDIWIHRISETLQLKLVYPHVLQYYRRHQKNISETYMKRAGEVGKLEYIYKSFLTVDSTYYKEELNLIRSLKTRLLEHNMLTKDKELRIESLITAHRERIDLIESGFLKKKIKAIELLKNGHYRSFSGYKSFLKDMIV